MASHAIPARASLDNLHPGDHLCFLFDSDEQHRRVVTQYMLQGLERGELVMYVTHAKRAEMVLGYLRDAGYDPDPYLQSGQLLLRTAGEFYLPNGVFDLDALLASLRTEMERIEAGVYSCVRFTSEKSWALDGAPGVERLTEYESRLNDLLRGSRCMALCQYDQRVFSPQTLLEVLHAHPLVVLNGQVVENRSFLPSRYFLGPERAAETLSRQLAALLEAHRAQTLLFDQSHVLRALLESGVGSVSIIDAQGTMLECNEVTARWLGIERQNMIGMPQFSYLEPELGKDWAAHVQETIRAREVRRVHEVYQDRHYDMIFHPVVDERSQVTRLLVTARDVSDMMHTLEALCESNELLNNMFDAPHLMLAYLDTNFDFVRVNKAYAEADGQTPEFYIGKNHFELYPNAENEALFRQVVQSGKPYVAHAKPFIYPVHPEWSVSWWDWSLHPLKDEAGQVQGLVLSLVDVTQRVQAEEEVRRHRDHLQELVAEQTAQLLEANARLKAEVAQHERTEQLVRRRNALLDAINTLLRRALTCQNSTEVAAEGLALARELTGSEAGFVDELNSAGMLDCIAFSGTTRYADRSPTDQGVSLPQGLAVMGLNAQVIHDHRSVIANQAQSHPDWIPLPANHPEIREYLGTPLFDGERLFGMMALINKTGGYTEQDQVAVEQLAAVLVLAFTRKRAEAALRESEERYRVLVETAAEGVWSVDADNQTVFVNQRLADLLGYTVTELMTHPPTDLMPPEDAADHLVKLQERSLGVPVHYERRFRRKDGSLVPTYISAAPRWDAEGHFLGSVGMITDMTERKRAEEMLRAASRLDATATLAGGVAHDFNNLMTVVLGNAEMLRIHYTSNPDALDMLQQVSSAAKQAGELAQQLLAYARGGRYQSQMMCLNDTVDEVLRLQKRVFPPRIRLERDLEPALWSALADPAQMSQVLTNLCLNAVEAIDGNGYIRVTTRNVIQDTPLTLLAGHLAPGRYVCLAVEDSGCGMTPEIMAHIFEPFFSTKFVGRGLGLPAAYGILQNHNGHITARSQPGQGSTFSVYLPAHEPTPKPVSSREIAIPLVTTEPEMVLVIDDEPMIRHVTRKMLEQLGYRVLLAEDGRQAVEIVRTAQQAIHIALLDMGMPVLSGAEVYPLLRAARNDLQVIVCSGYELDSAARALLAQGAAGFLQKPYQIGDLKRAIQDILGRAH